MHPLERLILYWFAKAGKQSTLQLTGTLYAESLGVPAHPVSMAIAAQSAFPLGPQQMHPERIVVGRLRRLRSAGWLVSTPPMIAGKAGTWRLSQSHFSAAVGLGAAAGWPP